MKSIKTFTALAAGAVVLSSAAVAQAQTPYGQTQTQSQSQPTGQEVFGQILQSLFGGQTTGTVDAEWSRGRRPLSDQQSTFSTRLDAQIRSGALSRPSGDRLRSDYDALVALEARYGQDGRFTTQERSELNQRYSALTTALEQGGYEDNLGGYQSVVDGRADFEGRIDAAVRARTLTRTEGTRLRADYAALIQTETGYQRGGLSLSERQDLEARLDALDARIPGDRYGSGNGGYQQSPRDRLTAVERALYSLPRADQDRLRVQVEDLTRLEAAYSRTRPSSDDSDYLERRIGELETQARVRR
ncbi:MAG: hypothetical protein KKA16_13360 [Alphaproteobacteria bacterium]|nr:hypothetical protein [Alphaproteobacteria bacterium]MBU2380592.1 hypothetical protein [Alphaproteobacteria bacterium]